MLLCPILSRIDILKFQINFCSQKLEKESHFSFLFLKVNFAGLVWSGTARTRISVSVTVKGSGQPLIPVPHDIASLTRPALLTRHCYCLSVHPEGNSSMVS